MEFPIEASVHCADGPGGKSMSIIVDPATEQVVSIAVRDADRPHAAYLVPVERVTKVTAKSIELNCTRAELEAMAPFIETEYLMVPTTNYGDDLYSYAGPETVAVEHPLVPKGTLAVNRGMTVEARDGFIGTVDELVVDKNSGRVTHLVLKKGHVWGQADVTLAVTQIERVAGGVVYLKLDKAAIEAMPIVQARRHYGKDELKALAVELLIVTFDGVDQADQALQALKSLTKADRAKIRNTAVLVKTEDGRTTFKEAEDVGPRQGALFGAISGGLIGLLGGPAGVILGAAAGAATGRVAADKIDRGFSNQYLETVQASLSPGSSALVALIEQEAVDAMAEALAGLNGQLVRLSLTDDLVSQLASASKTTAEDEPDKS